MERDLDKSRFLITGLPRCRTTWLTVVFNCVGVDTRHERDLYFDSMDQLRDWLDQGTEQNPHGLVDGFATIAYPTFALEVFKGHPIMFINRPVSEVMESWNRWLGFETPQGVIENAINNYYKFIDAMPKDALVINYSDLDNYDTLSHITEFCTNKKLNKSLFHFLNHTKIELHASKCAEFTKRNPKEYLQHPE